MQASQSISQQLILEPVDNLALANFVGELNGNLKIIEKKLLKVSIIASIILIIFAFLIYSFLKNFIN